MAWQKLSRNAVFVLMKFYEKFNGYNRYDLSLTYKEMKHKLSSLLFSNSILELEGFGFIDIRRLGRLERNCSLYGISNRWRKLSENPEALDKIEQTINIIQKKKRELSSAKKRMEINVLKKSLRSMSGAKHG